MKSPHTSGRKGQARVAEYLVRSISSFGCIFSIKFNVHLECFLLVFSEEKKNPDREISRTDVYVETHTRKDGSATREELVRILPYSFLWYHGIQYNHGIHFIACKELLCLYGCEQIFFLSSWCWDLWMVVMVMVMVLV